MSRQENLFTGIVNALQYVFLTLQIEDVFKWIQLGLSILSTLIIIIVNVVKNRASLAKFIRKLAFWLPKSLEDGKITMDEVEELDKSLKEECDTKKEDPHDKIQ